MAPAKPGVLRRSCQQASSTARAIFELFLLAVAVHIGAILYYKYISSTTPYYNLITNVGFFIPAAWCLICSYQLLGQMRRIYQPSDCRRRFHRRDTACNCYHVKTHKPEVSHNEFESIYLSCYTGRICLLVTSLHVAICWCISVRWLGAPIIGIWNAPLLADFGFKAPFMILRALFISWFNWKWWQLGLVAVYWLWEYLWVVMGVVLEDCYDDVHRKIEREFRTY